MVSAPSFLQHYLCIQPMLQYPPKNRSSTSVNFHLLFHPYLFTKPSLQSPPTSPSSTPHQFFTSPYLRSTIQNFYTEIFFLPQTFCQFRLRQGTMELGSLVRTETVLMPPFFLEVWAAITVLTITDSLSLRLRKLVYCRCRKPSNPPSFIPLNYCHYFHTLLIPPQELTFPWKPIS